MTLRNVRIKFSQFQAAGLVLAAIAILLLVSPTPSSGQAAGPAKALFDSANHERVTRGLAPLKWNDALAEAAAHHAQRMAEANTLSHQLPGEPAMAERATHAGARFSALAENVAEGPNAPDIHRQWMNSPPHRANLLDPHLDSVGIAVAPGKGVQFAVEDFSLAAGSLSIAQQEGVVAARIHSRGIRVLSLTNDARRSCVLDQGYAGKREPSFVLHYATPDLQTLPDLLEQRIRTGKYHSAAVGACPSSPKIEFSNYRIAVLLFDE